MLSSLTPWLRVKVTRLDTSSVCKDTHKTPWFQITRTPASGDSYTSNNHTFNISQTPRPSRSCPVGPAEGCLGPSTSNNGSQGNWILDITTEFNRSCTVLFNYAIAGAVVDGEIIAPGWPDTIKQNQLSMFNETVAHVPNIWANWTQFNTLASFFIGINDNYYTYHRPNHTE